MYLTNTAITRVTRTGVQDASGKEYPADVIILANGFRVGAQLHQVNIKGSKGRTLVEYWTEKKAVSSYRSTTISEFPNFFILDGPSSNSGHFSVIYSVECQVQYVNKLVCLLERS
jgi:cation diffusion facilitator CzcD-associated flavoprotein CzcO